MKNQITLVVLEITNYEYAIGSTHYYGKLKLVTDSNITVDNCQDYGIFGEEIEVKHKLSESEVAALNKNDDFFGNQSFRYEVGEISNRFETIEELTSCAIEEYKKLNLKVDFVSLFHGDKFDEQIIIRSQEVSK